MSLKQHDINLAGLSDDPESLGYEICTLIAHKGFCTIDTGLTETQIQQARDEVKHLQSRSRFSRPPSQIIEGLLGSSGSAEIAELSPSWDPLQEQADGPMLMDVDLMMSDIVASVLPRCPGTLGFNASDRTTAFLHRSDEDPFGFEEALNEKSASRWLNQFVRQKLTAFVFLGPKGGLLETRPHDGDSGAYDVPVVPGTMIILRCDLLSHQLSARNGELVMSISFMAEDLAGVRGAFNVGAEKDHPRTPVVKNLVAWSWNKLVELKVQQEEGRLVEWDDSVPRGWQLAASRRLSREQTKCAIRGIGFKMPGSDSFDFVFSSMIGGGDFAIDVPIKRWDHSLYYDPSPDCYIKHRFKTNVNHCCLCEGTEYFDNKFFGISNLEAKVMEPCQKNTLEDTYKALYQAGYSSKGAKVDPGHDKLMQKFIGVYTGSTGGEFEYVPHEAAGGMAGSEGSPAIVANRISFVLGMMGPSYALQVDAASALMAVYEGAFDVMPNGYKNKPMPDAACCQGVYTMLASYWWGVFNPRMDPKGRCMSFDDAGGGHIRSEGSESIVLKRHGDTVDGKFVVDGSYEVLGIVTGWAFNNQGKSSSLNAPNAQSLQMVMLDALRCSGIAPSDIDAVACHAEGLLLHDAVEVNATSRVLRGDSYGSEEALDLSNAACRTGQGQEAYGLMSLLMMLSYQRNGTSAGNIHLKTMNPYIETGDTAVNILTEALSMRTRTSYAGVTAHGFIGVNCHIQMSNEVDEDARPRSTLLLESHRLSFWPGGGGQIGYSAEPMRGYSVLGSWSSWEDIEQMEYKGSGVYSFVVTLGENRFEQFQILLDGDRSRTLHPGCAKASLGSAVFGPDVSSDADGYSWLLDGRPRIAGKHDSNDLERWEACEVDTPQTGIPGDQYNVQIQIAGKWRTVTWEKIGSRVETPAPGKYFVCASSSGWSLEEMIVEDPSTGVYSMEIFLESRVVFFQILRNKDTDQTLYPVQPDSGSSDSFSDSEVEGPGEYSAGACWKISGAVGDVIRIEFKRTFEQGQDKKHLLWNKIGSRDPKEERLRKQKELEKKAAERRAREEREAEELEALLRMQG